MILLTVPVIVTPCKSHSITTWMFHIIWTIFDWFLKCHLVQEHRAVASRVLDRVGVVERATRTKRSSRKSPPKSSSRSSKWCPRKSRRKRSNRAKSPDRARPTEIAVLRVGGIEEDAQKAHLPHHLQAQGNFIIFYISTNRPSVVLARVCLFWPITNEYFWNCSNKGEECAIDL